MLRERRRGLSWPGLSQPSSSSLDPDARPSGRLHNALARAAAELPVLPARGGFGLAPNMPSARSHAGCPPAFGTKRALNERRQVEIGIELRPMQSEPGR